MFYVLSKLFTLILKSRGSVTLQEPGQIYIVHYPLRTFVHKLYIVHVMYHYLQNDTHHLSYLARGKKLIYCRILYQSTVIILS